jgi:uncharacterized NAD-dependent epimerase/dehydratase family protein
MSNQTNSAVVYCEKKFGTTDGKTANGLVRFSAKYKIAGVIDSTKAGRDAGEVLDGHKNGIPIYKDLTEALETTQSAPKYFIYGIAPPNGMFSEQDRQIMFFAMEKGMNIVNGLHEFLTEDEAFIQKAQACGVKIYDIRKPKDKKALNVFSNRITEVKCPKIAVLGTDSAVGKRTSAIILTKALCDAGLKTTMVATGQTGLIQGFRYGVVLDAIPEQFISGEMENAVIEAYEHEKSDLIIIEGQGSLSHPAFLSSCFIIRGSQPDAIIIQHSPKRKTLDDYPTILMPTLESEIKLLEVFSGSKVIGITINHTNMTDKEIDLTIKSYEERFRIPASDLLKYDCEKLVRKIVSTFPELTHKVY